MHLVQTRVTYLGFGARGSRFRMCLEAHGYVYDGIFRWDNPETLNPISLKPQSYILRGLWVFGLRHLLEAEGLGSRVRSFATWVSAVGLEVLGSGLKQAVDVVAHDSSWAGGSNFGMPTLPPRVWLQTPASMAYTRVCRLGFRA